MRRASVNRSSWRSHVRRTWSALLLVTLVLAWSAPSLAAQPLVKVRTGIVAAIDQLGTPVALELGFFEKWGLDVTIANPYATGVDQLNALQAGEIDIGQVGVPMIGAVLRGMDLVILGSYSGSAAHRGIDATMALVAREGSGIKTLADLRGKRIGVSFGTINHLYLLGLLKKAGLTVNDVVAVNTPPADMPIALQTRALDAFVNWDPWPILALLDVKGSYEVVRGGGVIGFLGYIVTTPSYAEKNPDVVVRFLEARAEADQWMRQNPEGTARVAARWIPGIRPEVALAASRYNIAQLDIRLSAYNYQALDDAQKLLFELKFLPGTFDVNKVFMPGPIHRAAQEHPELFAGLVPIPQEARWYPGYVYRAQK